MDKKIYGTQSNRKKIYQCFKSPNELAENLNNKNNNHKQNLAKKLFKIFQVLEEDLIIGLKNLI